MFDQLQQERPTNSPRPDRRNHNFDRVAVIKRAKTG